MNGAIWTMQSLLWGHRGGSSPALTRHLACFPVSISHSLVTRWMQTNMDSYQNLEEEKKKKRQGNTKEFAATAKHHLGASCLHSPWCKRE